MNPTIKRYLTSSTTTFLTVFFATLSVNIGHLNGAIISGTLVWSLIMIAARAAVKGVIEKLTGDHADVPVA